MDISYYIKETSLVFVQIFTLVPLVMVLINFMGRRSIGELSVFDFLVILLIGHVVGADFVEGSSPRFYSYATIILLALLQMLVSRLVIKYRSFGRWISFEPVVVIRDGQFLVKNMTKIRYTIDNVLVRLRDKDIFDVSEVDTGIIESNGKLTIYKKANKSNVTREDLGLTKTPKDFAYPLIVDGQLYSDVLRTVNVDENWLQGQLRQQGVTDVDQVFFASLNKQKELHISLKEQQDTTAPQVYH